MAKSFHPIFDIIDGASADFDKVVEASEKKILQETLSLIKGLETDAQGNIKTTISNLKKIGVIKTRLTKIANNKQFLAGVAKLIGAFDKIYNEQKKYFDSLSSNFVAHTNYHMGASSKFELMKSLAAQNVANNLTGAGLSANVTGKISDMLLRAVTTGAKYSDIVSEMHAYLLSTETSQGALSKYAKTYAVTALGQYTGQNNKLVTDDLGCEWFMYTGSTIETTREFCAHMTKKKYIHISEFADILAGKIDGHECAIYDKTGLPHGLIEGTTPENFLVNVGGWNCRHQLVPIAKEMVPAEIRAKFEKPKQPTKEEIEAQKKAEEEARRKAELEKRISEATEMLSKMDGFKGYDPKGLKQAIKAKDSESLAKLIKEAQDLYEIYDDLIMLDNPRQYARDFTLQELKEANAGITRTLAGLPSSLKERINKLEFEIKWVEKHKKYSTWKVAQDAYKKELAKVQKAYDIELVRKDAQDAMLFASMSSSKIVKRYASELDAMLSSGNIDISQAKAKLKALQNKIEEIKQQGMKPAISDREQKCQPKTVEELASELGEKMPKTLTNLQKAIDQYEKSRHYGKETKANKQAIERQMREIFDSHDFGMNIDDHLLEQVLKSYFKNTFEVGGGNGYVGSRKTTGKIETSHARLRAAHEMFGLGKDLQKDQFARGDYEKYGNLLDHDILASMKDNPARQYGNVQIRFKKDKVLATWTPCDSLNAGHQPSLCSDPKACSYDDASYILPKSGTSTKSFGDWRRKHIRSYLELQFHGKLTPDCVESITFPYNVQTSSYYNVALEWKKLGVKIYYIDGGKLFML